jgi:N-acetylmuramoyl-L-alanine amidase
VLVATVALALLVGLIVRSHPAPVTPGVAAADTRTPPDSRAIDPKYFEPGSCVLFFPTKGDRHLTVFLDAGHGGLDPGSVGVTEEGQTIYEADETLPVELDAATDLRAAGFDVVVSRTRASTVVRPQPGDISGGLFTAQGEHRDVAARDVCANEANANILVGIYFDAGSYDNAGSVTGYDTVRPFAAENLRLATLVQNDVLAAMNAQGWDIPSEGVVDDTQLGGPALTNAAASYDHLLLLGPADPGWFDTPSLMPGALIEPLFITDPFEGSLAASTQGQQVIAQGLATAVEQYFGPPVVAKARTGAGAATTTTARGKSRPA